MENIAISQLVQVLAHGVEEQRSLDYTLVASITLLAFDWLLTLDLEVSLVWNSPMSGTKLLFLLNRYLPFVDVPITLYFVFGHALPRHRCEMTFQAFGWMLIIGQSSAALLLTLRTWAVCGKSKLATYGLFGAFGMVVTPIMILNGFNLKTSTFKASPFPQFLGCLYTVNRTAFLAFMYVLHMVYDGGLLLLMVVQGVYAFRMAGRSQLTTVVFRDGILYYIYIFGLSLINTIVIFRLNGDYKNLLVLIERVVHSILACRVVLHIREQGEMEKQGMVPSEQMTGPLRFAHPTQGTSLMTTGISE